MSTATLFEQLVPILHEDDDLIAVAKPPGLGVGMLPHSKERGIAEILNDQQSRAGADGSPTPPLVPANRLGRHESGVLLLAKNPAMLRHIRAGLRAGKIRQDFLMVVRGEVKGRAINIEPGAKGKPKPLRRAKKTAVPRSQDKKTVSRAGLTTITESVQVHVLLRSERRLLVRCSTNARSIHALRALLRSADLHALGDRVPSRAPSRHAYKSKGRPLTPAPAVRKFKDDMPSRTCVHLSKISFHHPTAQKKITITAPKPLGFEEVAQGKDNVESCLTAALASRVECLMDHTTDSFRLINGNVEGLPGLLVEKYGSVIIFQIMEDRCKINQATQRRIGRFYMTRFAVQAIYRKVFPKDRNPADLAEQSELRSPTPFLGKLVEPTIEILERGIKLVVKPYDGYAVGIFLDHRDNRARVRELARGKRVLNLFSYTCGFSVAAALGGADSVVSVDLSKAHLEWGKENFARNNLSLTGHQFIACDVLDYFKRAKRQEKTFDLIIMDPPTFARLKKPKRTFSITEALPALVQQAVEILEHKGTLVVSTNCRKLGGSKLMELIRTAGSSAGSPGRPTKLRVSAAPPLPPDFAADPQHAKTVYLRAQ